MGPEYSEEYYGIKETVYRKSVLGILCYPQVFSGRITWGAGKGLFVFFSKKMAAKLVAGAGADAME